MKALAAALVDSAVWAGWGSAAGFAFSRLPVRYFLRDGLLTRSRSWEADGRFWRDLGVRRWKSRVPELGALFGGTSKRRLLRGGEGVARMAAETRRAEAVHWVAVLPILPFAFWEAAWLTAVMAGYAVAANAPCIIIQRYNRPRLSRLGQRCAARQVRAPAGATAPDALPKEVLA
jgi:glycosyl-4,4'-diaponeurosporenoate acyltransferase